MKHFIHSPRSGTLLLLFFFLLPVSCRHGKEREVILPLSQGFLRLQVVRDDIVRVTVSPVDQLHKRKSLMIAGNPNAPVHLTRKEEGDTLVITTARLQVRLDRKNGTILFCGGGSPYLAAGAPAFTPVKVDGEKGPVYSVLQPFHLSGDEALYGLGQYQDGVMNLRGHNRILFQENTVAVNPFLLSTRHYGILWDNYSLTKFHDGEDSTYLWSKVADAVDYYFVAGDNADSVIAGYRRLTGAAPMYGKWAYGYWQSKERYHNQYEVTGVVREYRRRHLPLDNIVQDWMYWGDLGWNALQFDSTRYPHPKEMIDTVHALHAHIMISIWPNFGAETAVYRAMKERGYLITDKQGGDRGLYDPYNPAARDYYWHWLNRHIFSPGMDGWWMDATEPEVAGATLRERVAALEGLGRNALGSMARYLNSYSLMTTKGVYENQRKTTAAKRVYILTRSAYAGQQRYAATTWSGDIHARWEVLQHQITAGINFCMSGIPYWTTDIGAFLPDNPLGNRDNAYRELYVRWFQFGTFCPVFRSHGSGTAREIYHFGDKNTWSYQSLQKFDRLRYRLLPYIYSLAWQVTHNGYTIMRGLPMDFPGDGNVLDAGREYMFGPAFLVAPVTEKMYFNHNYTGRVIPPGNLFNRDGRRGSLTAAFFNGIRFDTLAATGTISHLDVNWNDDRSRPPAVHRYHYSIRMTGELSPPESGTYTLVTTSNDGIRVIAGKDTVIENWTPHGATMDMGDIALEKNHRIPFTVEYFQTLGSAVTRIAWILPSEKDTLREQDLPPAKTYPVYLPEGTSWYDFWRGTVTRGGRTIQVPAPIDEMPLFVKAGTILPLGPYLQWAGEKPADTLELRIYPGNDGSFLLYEDENDNYNYEKGIYATIPFTWNEKQQTLTIGKREGSFPGMPEKRIFRIVWVRENHGTGISPEKAADRTVTYTGKKIVITPLTATPENS